MATELTSAYQYIGRSNAVSCPAGYNYYILVYAKTSGNNATGKHTVSIKARLACDVDSSFYAFTTTASASADGVSAWSWSKQQIPYDYWGDSSSLTVGGVTYPRWTELKEGSAVVNAGYGVEKDISIDVSWVMNSSSSQRWFPYTGKPAKASITVTLPMLAGASSFTLSGNGKTSAGNVYVISDGTNQLKVTISRDATSFTHHVDYYMGSKLLAEYSGITTGHSPKISPSVWVPYITDRKNTTGLSDANAPSVKVTTYDGSGNKIGSAVSQRFDIFVPDDFAPTVTIDSVDPVSDLAAPFNDIFIQSKSKVNAIFSGQGYYDATIQSYIMTVEGESYDSSDEYTSGYLSGYGDKTVKITAKDSRGYTGSDSKTISVIAYSKPKIGVDVCGRCDSNGNLSDSGTYLKIKATRSYSKVVDEEGTQNNYCLIRYRYKTESGTYSSWMTLLDRTTNSTNTADSDALLNGALDVKTSYVVQVGVIDDIGSTATATFVIGTEEVYMHRTRNAMGLGKYVEEENILDIAWNTRVRGELRLGDEGSPVEDFVVEKGLYTDDLGSWRYRKWHSGTYDMSGIFEVQPTESNVFSGGGGYFSNQIQIQLPFAIESIQYTGTPAEQHYWLINAALVNGSEGLIGFRLARFGEINTTSPVNVRLVAQGRWK